MTLLARVSASGVLVVLVESVLAFGSWRLLPDARGPFGSPRCPLGTTLVLGGIVWASDLVTYPLSHL